MSVTACHDKPLSPFSKSDISVAKDAASSSLDDEDSSSSTAPSPGHPYFFPRLTPTTSHPSGVIVSSSDLHEFSPKPKAGDNSAVFPDMLGDSTSSATSGEQPTSASSHVVPKPRIWSMAEMAASPSVSAAAPASPSTIARNLIGKSGYLSLGGTPPRPFRPGGAPLEGGYYPHPAPATVARLPGFASYLPPVSQDLRRQILSSHSTWA